MLVQIEQGSQQSQFLPSVSTTLANIDIKVLLNLSTGHPFEDGRMMCDLSVPMSLHISCINSDKTFLLSV